MTKQEEIKYWFCKYLALFNGQLNYDRLPRHRKDSYKLMVEEDIMPYLHSQGIVIKVDRKLPRLTINISDKFHPDYADMSGEWVRPDAGYVSTIPLIEES